VECKVKIPLEATDVVITGMENLLNIGSGEKITQFSQIIENKRIQQEVRRWAGKLYQAHPFVISVQAIRLGIDRDGILGG